MIALPYIILCYGVATIASTVAYIYSSRKLQQEEKKLFELETNLKKKELRI